MRIAIVRLSSLGDVIGGMFVLQFIKKHYPGSSIEWFVDSRFSGILEHNPDIDKVHALPLKQYKKSPKTLIKKVREKRASLEDFDLIVDMQGLIKSAVLTRCLGKKSVGFSYTSTKEKIAALLYKKKVVTIILLSYTTSKMWKQTLTFLNYLHR